MYKNILLFFANKGTINGPKKILDPCYVHMDNRKSIHIINCD